MTQRQFLDSRIATAADLRPRSWLYLSSDSFGYVARIGEVGDWSAYEGRPDWSWERIAESGHKLPEKKARQIFPVCRHLTYKPALKIVPFKPKHRPSVRAVLNSFEETLLEAGFEEIEDLKTQQLQAAMLLNEALAIARRINGSSVKDWAENLSELINQLEETMMKLQPLEERTPVSESVAGATAS